jgi:hypothetical protein
MRAMITLQIPLGQELQVVAQQLLKAITITTAGCKLLAVVHHDQVLASESRLQFLDMFDIDDAGAVDANETLRIEALFEIADRLTNQV